MEWHFRTPTAPGAESWERRPSALTIKANLVVSTRHFLGIFSVTLRGPLGGGAH